EFASHRHAQPGKVIFEEIVPRSGPHCLNGPLFTQRARHEDERDLDPQLLDYMKCTESVEPWHGEIRNNDIPRVLGESFSQVAFRGDTPPHEFEPAPFELASDEFCVLFVIFDEQEVDQVTHLCDLRLPASACRFRRSSSRPPSVAPAKSQSQRRNIAWGIAPVCPFAQTSFWERAREVWTICTQFENAGNFVGCGFAS